MAMGVPIGKRNVCTAFCLFGSALIRLWRPLRRFAPLSKSARKTEITCHCEERGTSDVAIRIPIRRTKTIDSPKENGFPRRASPSCDGGFAA